MSNASPSDVYYDSADHEITRNPFAVFKRLRDEAPLYYNEQRDFYAVSRYDDVVKVLVDNTTYINRFGGTIDMIKSGIEIPPGTVLFEDEPSHALHRALALPHVHTEEGPGSRLGDPEVLHRRARLRGRRRVRLRNRPRRRGPDARHRHAARHPDRTAGARYATGWTADRDEPDERYVGHIFDAEVLLDYVKWRQQNPSNDVVTELLTAEFDDEQGVRRTMTIDELLMFVNVLAAAGNETTGRLITFCGQLLAEHPDQRRMLVDDPDLIRGAVEEVSRYEPPAIEGARYVAKDVEHHGRTVPAGSAMAVILASANRDERHYENPDEFDIMRRPTHVSLSWGPHYCLGANLARVEAKVVLEEVLKRYPEWQIDTDGAVFDVSPPLRSWSKLPVLPG